MKSGQDLVKSCCANQTPCTDFRCPFFVCLSLVLFGTVDINAGNRNQRLLKLKGKANKPVDQHHYDTMNVNEFQFHTSVLFSTIWPSFLLVMKLYSHQVNSLDQEIKQKSDRERNRHVVNTPPY